MGMEINNGHNNTYPKGGVSSSKDSFVIAESTVLRTNFCADKARPSQIYNTLVSIIKMTTK